MRGYHNLPEQTAETLDADGWLHSGDIGHVEDGFVKITDRKKDLIKTSGGKYVAPQMLERKLTVACPYVSHSLAHGDNRNFVSMLIALDPEAITKWAAGHGLGGKSYAEVATSKEVRDLIAPFIDEVNKDVASWEQVKKWTILPADLTLEAGRPDPVDEAREDDRRAEVPLAARRFPRGDDRPPLRAGPQSRVTLSSRNMNDR